MVIVMSMAATDEQISAVVERVQDAGLTPHLVRGVERTVVGLIGHGVDVRSAAQGIEVMAGVENLVPVTKPFKLSAREFHEADSIVQVNGVAIGGEEVVV
ncbi:MAG: 3-deoxy-7-phosphoheptulonate synthase, partial [Chloroflexota bacterium]|nr:3-deoxy-7-phosphoheptulonate synthase [Chloroflexota bacterium]